MDHWIGRHPLLSEVPADRLDSVGAAALGYFDHPVAATAAARPADRTAIPAGSSAGPDRLVARKVGPLTITVTPVQAGQTSSTGQVAWSEMKRVTGPSRVRTGPGPVTVAAQHQQVGDDCCRSHGPLRPAVQDCRFARSAQPRGRGSQQLVGGTVIRAGRGGEVGGTTPEQAGGRCAHHLVYVVAHNVDQRDPAVGRCPERGDIHRGLPGASFTIP